MSAIASQIRTRIASTFAIARERREHDSAMIDPRVRDEHFAARSRAVAAGHGDCPFCA
jgi:hypothetical protein